MECCFPWFSEISIWPSFGLRSLLYSVRQSMFLNKLLVLFQQLLYSNYTNFVPKFHTLIAPSKHIFMQKRTGVHNLLTHIIEFGKRIKRFSPQKHFATCFRVRKDSPVRFLSTSFLVRNMTWLYRPKWQWSKVDILTSNSIVRSSLSKFSACTRTPSMSRMFLPFLGESCQWWKGSTGHYPRSAHCSLAPFFVLLTAARMTKWEML